MSQTNGTESGLEQQLALEEAANWADPTDDDCKPEARKLPRDGYYAVVAVKATSGVNKKFGNYEINLEERILGVPGDLSTEIKGQTVRSRISLPKVNPHFVNEDGSAHKKPEDWSVLAAFPAFFPNECPAKPVIAKGSKVVTYRGEEIGEGNETYEMAIAEWKRASLSRIKALYMDPAPFVGGQTYVLIEKKGEYVNVKKRFAELPADASLVDSDSIFEA